MKWITREKPKIDRIACPSQHSGKKNLDKNVAERLNTARKIG